MAQVKKLVLDKYYFKRFFENVHVNASPVYWKFMYVPQRYVLVATSCLATIFIRATRRAWIICWPYMNALNETIKVDGHSPVEKTAKIVIMQLDDLDWTLAKRNHILASYYLLYFVTQVTVGIFSDLYGGKQFVSISVLFSGVMNLLLPTVIMQMPKSMPYLAIGTLGAIQAMFLPGLISMLSQWIPNYQFSLLYTLAISGDPLGRLFSVISGVQFLERIGNWYYVFSFWGFLSCMCFLLCKFFMYSSPRSHPFISVHEKRMVERDNGIFPNVIPWWEIISHSPVWAMVAAHVSHHLSTCLLFDFWVIIFRYAVGLTSTISWVYLSLPYIAMWASSILGGYLADLLTYNRNKIPMIYLRITFTAIGLLLPCVFSIMGAYDGCNKIYLIACFTFAMLSKGAIFPGMYANIMDITRHFSGCVVGLVTGLSMTSEIIVPHLIQFMCPNDSIYEWQKLLWLSFSMCLLGSILYFIWARGEKASWDFIDEDSF